MTHRFRSPFIFRILLSIFFCGILSPIIFAEEGNDPPVKSLNILTIGNSFSYSLSKNDIFLHVVRSVPGFDVNLQSLSIGGWTLQGHWENIVKEEANREDRHFKDFTYREKLESEKWDFVSIQQSSPLSWRPESYWPWATDLRDYVRRYAPTAEIVLQQTWSYRPDDQRLAEWGLTQGEMADRIVDAYNQAAERLDLRIIPVGWAVKLARENQPGGYEPFRPEDYEYPDLPSMDRFLVGNVKWSDDHSRIEGDSYHLNLRGRYLQSCVWFAFLYDHPATDVTYVPEGMTDEDARFLREMAQKAVEEFPQTRKK